MVAKKERVERVCEWCNEKFLILESHMKRPNRGKFCSKQCSARSRVEWLNKNRKPATHNPGWFVSEKVTGRSSPSWKEGEYRQCKNCGNAFQIKHWILRQKSNKGEFCSVECRGEYRKKFQSGENSPLWRGGIKSYRGRNWKQIRLVVVNNQKGICADCGKHVGQSLPVHHIEPFRNFTTAVEANKIENLIGLCQSCHMKRERKS